MALLFVSTSTHEVRRATMVYLFMEGKPLSVQLVEHQHFFASVQKLLQLLVYEHKLKRMNRLQLASQDSSDLR